MTVCLCLGLQWGGVEKAWDSASVVVLLVMIPVSMTALVAWSIFLGPQRAMIPLELLKRRTILGSALTSGEFERPASLSSPSALSWPREKHTYSLYPFDVLLAFGWMAFMVLPSSPLPFVSSIELTSSFRFFLQAVVLYLSISFQAVNGHSATRAGVDLLRQSIISKTGARDPSRRG